MVYVSVDITENTSHSLATNNKISKLCEAEVRNHGNGGDSDIEVEGYNHIKLFTNARIEAEVNCKDADINK